MRLREVWKASARKNSSTVALKKILVHNEKDGVSGPPARADQFILRHDAVPNHRVARDQIAQDAFPSERAEVGGNGR